MNKLLNNTALSIMAGLILAACGGGSDQAPASSQALLADGEACNAAWSSSTPYNGGAAVSYSGRNYTAAYWTQGNSPATNSGPAGSGQYWITGYTCGGGATTTTASGTTTTKAATTTTAAATTTTVGSSCTYQNWASGVNYPLGTIVKYAANGNYYKEVQAGTNGSDGTDPTISTWYWSATTCSGGGGTTTTTAGSGGSFVVSETQFNNWFPARNSFYTYADLIAAMAYYPSFAKSGNATVDKQEAAAFFANLQHESDSLKAVREYNTANYPLYCDVNWVQVACRSSNWSDEYFGRGPIQISWTTNYRNLSSAMGLGTQLVDNPELLATNATIAWRSALWYWMTQVGPNTITPHAAITGGSGFGQTIKSINGARECVGGSAYSAEGHTQMQVRVNYYTTFTGNLGVATGSNLTC